MVSDAEEMGTGHVLNGRHRARDLYLYYSQDMTCLQSYRKDPITVSTKFARLQQYSHGY